MNIRGIGLAVAAIAVLGGSAASAATYNWTFTVDALSDGFDGPPAYMNQVLGSGTLTLSDSYTAGTCCFGDTAPARVYAVTGITGTFAGSAITGLAPEGATMPVATVVGWSSFTANNELDVVPGQGWALSPNGSLLVSVSPGVDAGTVNRFDHQTLSVDGGLLALNADNFMWGGFVDTQRGNEWQGSMSLSISPVGAPEPAAWVELMLGAGLSGLALRRRRSALARNPA